MRVSYLILILALFITDQVSKWWVIELLLKPKALPGSSDASAMPFLQWIMTKQEQLPFIKVDVWPFFDIVMVWNKGISFGLFNAHSEYGPYILMAVAAAIITAFLIWLHRSTHALVTAGLIMIIGGALGNILDRARFGAVADFLDFHVGTLHWPAFNIADSTICLGIAMLLVHGLFFETKKAAKEVVST